MRTIVLGVLCSLLIAGCASNEDPATEPATKNLGVEPGSAESPTTEALGQEPEAEPVPTPVKIEGSIGTGACVPYVEPGTCFGVIPLDNAGAWTERLNGDATSFSFDLEWDATTPASTFLRVRLICVEGIACEEPEVLADVEGTSPMLVEVEGDWSKGTTMTVRVDPINPTAPAGLLTQIWDQTIIHGEGSFQP